ncbi:Shugoshin [Aspergillus similis]
MARLNESTASSEPIEILKRRFVRQNREIARVNSIQSLRIRSLESEVSHLLSENVSLREQIITLTQDLERFEAARTLHDGVYDVKARLDSKLVELSNLITELGSLPRRYSRAICDNGESAPARQPRKSGSKKEVDDTDPDPNLGFFDGRLPVIMEDKFYPRRTLTAQELREIRDSDTDNPNSPGLEDSSISPKQTVECDEASTGAPAYSMCTNAIVDHIEDEHPLPPNLETRRKKKLGPATVNKDQAESRSISLLDSKFTRKRGAKRKFSAEDDESLFESSPSEDDEFQFSRPTQSPKIYSQHEIVSADDDSGELRRPLQSPRLSSQNDHSPIKMKPQPSERSIVHVQGERKVLEPKSTNTNILSPTKPSNIKDYNQNHDLGYNEKNENSLPRQGKGAVSRSKNASPKKSSIRAPVYGNDVSKSGNKQGKNGEVKPNTPSLNGMEHSEITTTADMPSTRQSRRRGAVSQTESHKTEGVSRPL